jgi:hypothetical protein
MASSQLGRLLLPLIDQMYHHTTYPAFGGEIMSRALGAIRFDIDGNLWVQEYRMSGPDSESWQSFSPTGEFVRRIDFPPKTNLLDIGTDYVLLKVIDDLDVEHVVLYGLERGQ